LGVAFLGAAFFLVAAALVAGAEGAVLLVTRPDLVLPRITGAFSSTAGAWTHVSTHYKSTVVRAHTGALFLTLETLALVLVALAGAAAFLVAVALGAALVAAFLGAAFLAGASFAAVWSTSVQEPEEVRYLKLTVFLALAAAVFGAALVLVSVFLVSAFLGAGGELALFFASLTGPEAPVASQNRVEPAYVVSRSGNDECEGDAYPWGAQRHHSRYPWQERG